MRNYLVALAAISSLIFTTGCLDSSGLSRTAEARGVFVETFNANAPDGCQLEGTGVLTSVTYSCRNQNLDKQRADLQISCETYSSLGFEIVVIATKGNKMTCNVAASCECKT